MDQDHLLEQAQRLLKNTDEDPAAVTPMPDVLLLRHRRPTQFSGAVYDPVVCLILQRPKETRQTQLTQLVFNA